MCDRAQKIGLYAALVVWKGAERRVITDANEVPRLFVDKFKRLMSYEREAWYMGLRIGEDSEVQLRLQ